MFAPHQKNCGFCKELFVATTPLIQRLPTTAEYVFPDVDFAYDVTVASIESLENRTPLVDSQEDSRHRGTYASSAMVNTFVPEL